MRYNYDEFERYQVTRVIDRYRDTYGWKVVVDAVSVRYEDSGFVDELWFQQEEQAYEVEVGYTYV